jgi:hypothetical protein
MLARQIAIGFGTAIIFPLLVYYGVSTFFHAPKWPDFHAGITIYNPKPTPDELAERQAKQKAESDAYAEANRVFSLELLYIAAPLGYLAIIIGSRGPTSGLYNGLIFGGILTVTIGYCSHWVYLENWLRFVSLLAAMAVLVLISYWRVSRPAGGASSKTS